MNTMHEERRTCFNLLAGLLRRLLVIIVIVAAHVHVKGEALQLVFAVIVAARLEHCASITVVHVDDDDASRIRE